MQGPEVFVIDDDDLHVAGDLPDEHPVSPFFDDEGEVVLADLAGGIPAQLAGAGVDGEGGGGAGFAGGAESGGVLVGWYESSLASVVGQGGGGHAQAEGEAVAIGIEGGRVVAELLADSSRIEGGVEHDGGRVGQQGRVDQNRRRHIKPNLVGGSR